MSGRAFGIGLIAAAAAGIALAGSALTREPVSNDEVASLALVSRSFGDLLGQVFSEHNGVLHDIILWPVVALGGVSSAWMRLPSLVAFGAAIIVCGLVGSRIATRFVGLCAAGFLALNPFSIRYAQEGRMYAFALLLALLSVWALLRALERPSAGRWAAYALAVAAMGYAHDFALLTVLAHPVLVFSQREKTVRRPFGIALAGAALALVPLGVGTATDWGSDPLYWVQRPGLGTIGDTIGEFTGGGATAILLTVVLAGGVAVHVSRRRAGVVRAFLPGAPSFLAVWLFAPFVMLFVFSQAKPLLVPRYVLPSVAALCLALALSLSVFPQPLALAGTLAVAALLGLGSVQDNLERTKPDWPGVVSLLGRQRADTQRIVFVGGQRNAAAFLYYAPEFGVPRDHLPWTDKELAELPESLVIIDRGSTVDDLARALSGSSPAWLVRQGLLPEETERAVDEFLRRCEISTGEMVRGISVGLVRTCTA